MVPNQSVAVTRREGAPDFVLRQPFGRRVPPRVAGSRIDLDDSARRPEVEVSRWRPRPCTGRSRPSGCVRLSCRSPGWRVDRSSMTAHGAVQPDDPESAQAIEMKADDAEGLASIEDRLEAAVTVREQAGLPESKEQLTGGPSTIAGREVAGRDVISASPSGAPYVWKSSVARRQRRSLTSIRQLGDQPDVASCCPRKAGTARRLAAREAGHSGRRAGRVRRPRFGERAGIDTDPSPFRATTRPGDREAR